MLQNLETPHGRRIAYHKTEGGGPTIVFLGGLKSDMEGTKALHLESWAQAQGRAFLRFDYSGHGQSSGTFSEGCIGDWAADTIDAVSALTQGPLIVIGSSMGGWQALLLAKAMPDRLAGLVTIAAAPDFIENNYWKNLSDDQKQALDRDGHLEFESDYMEPYIISKRMIEDGRKQSVLRDPLPLPFPVRCLQGTEDSAVSTETALQLLEHATCADMRLTFVKGADHRFSDESCLEMIVSAVTELVAGDV